jgi:predicted DsbA family dithiol-disulfide isomerase
MEKALKQSRVKAEVEWIPFELYAHQEGHRIHREHIQGNEHLDKIYQQLSLIAAEERIIIRQHPYEKSSRRALTGILFARSHGKIDEYMRDVYAEVFEYGNDISSLMVLGRIALKLGWNVEEFLRFVDEKKNQDKQKIL